MYQGGCLCEQVQYEFDHFEGDFVACHCRSCRKASGSAFAVNLAVAQEQFRITQGFEAIKTYESSPGKVRHFCGECGSPLFTQVAGTDYVRVRIGSVDTPIEQTPKADIFCAHRASWDTDEPRTLQYETWPDQSRVDIRGTTRKN